MLVFDAKHVKCSQQNLIFITYLYNIFVTINVRNTFFSIYQYKLKAGIQRLSGLHFENGHLIIVTSLRLSIIFHVKLSVRKGNKLYATTICSKEEKVCFLKKMNLAGQQKNTPISSDSFYELKTSINFKEKYSCYLAKKIPFGQYFDFVKRINN